MTDFSSTQSILEDGTTSEQTLATSEGSFTLQHSIQHSYLLNRFILEGLSHSTGEVLHTLEPTVYSTKLPELTMMPITTEQPNKEHVLNQNFESGIMEPWKDDSVNEQFQWAVEDWIEKFVSGDRNVIPAPEQGQSYLAMRPCKTQDPDLPCFFGVAILSSPIFNRKSGDRLNFSYWLNTKLPGMNNLEVDKLE